MKKSVLFCLLLTSFVVLVACEFIAETNMMNETEHQSNGLNDNEDVTEEEPNGPDESDEAEHNESDSSSGPGEENENENDAETSPDTNDGQAAEPDENEEQPSFTPPYSFDYPDAVRGIYVTGHSAGASRMERLLDFVESTDLNAMVIDIKDDKGNITFKLDDDHPYAQYSRNYIGDLDALLKEMDEREIYPIARIVVFKDSVVSMDKHDWTFLQGNDVWKNNRKEAFINPFLKDVWDYNIEFAKLAAEKGFKEIQFDYVRFPEGFERRDDVLTYEWGEYSPIEVTAADGSKSRDLATPRVKAITDFAQYAKEQLSAYPVDVSIDVFGYTAVDMNATGIGQNFAQISAHVDVISSMIYPSHWGLNYFGIPKPDLEPYRLVQEYAKAELRQLSQLENPPVSRPWIQDFTAPWLGKGNYKSYGKEDVEAQIRALNEAGIWEFLLWNAGNSYTEDVNYLPIGKPPAGEDWEPAAPENTD